MADQPQLKVVGAGVATGTPDQCQLQIGLSCVADEAAAALSTCAELAARAIGAIEDATAPVATCRRWGSRCRISSTRKISG